MGRDALQYGALLIAMDESDIEEHLQEHDAWTDLYDEKRRLPIER
jgi:hypothetical protein